MMTPLPQYRGGQGAVPTPPKRANMEEPVLFSDNTSSGSNPGLLTVTEAAKFLNISKSSIRRLQQKRLIPFIKVGGSIRFAKSDLMSYLEKGRVESIG